MTDDFCKEFALQQGKYMVKDKKQKHRNKPNRMSDRDYGYSHFVPLGRFPLLQALLQGICAQTPETPVYALGIL